MELIQLDVNVPLHARDKVHDKITKFQNLLGELGERQLTEEVVMGINEHIQAVNEVTVSAKVFSRELSKRQAKILTILQKKLKLVPKHYYRNLWMVLGMSAFGIPIGTVMGAVRGNMGLIGIGLPIGMCIGIAVGSFMDANAKKEDKQLEFGS